MPTLLEVQRAVRRSLVAPDDAGAALYIVADGLFPEARLNIYRNTLIGTLTTALRLSFPAVHRLVCAEFFESAARIFMAAQPPRSAYLNDYGEAFPGFLSGFAPAASVPYLSDVARLEWAVHRALHAIDVGPLDLSALLALDPVDQSRVAFERHPSIGLVEADYPADAIWRAVLDEDDDAMAKIDLQSGPVRLLVERRQSGIEVTRCREPAWRFACALFDSRPLQDAIDAAPEIDASVLLADHLAAGRIAAFRTVEPQGASIVPEAKQ